VRLFFHLASGEAAAVSHLTARRVGGGAPLRAAMTAKGLKTIQDLAAATREIDPEGNGVSWQLIASFTTTKRHARETTSPRTAALIEDALESDRGSLFAVETVYAKADRLPDFDAL
jgi:hypothetical protein